MPDDIEVTDVDREAAKNIVYLAFGKNCKGCGEVIFRCECPTGQSAISMFGGLVARSMLQERERAARMEKALREIADYEIQATITRIARAALGEDGHA